MCKKNEKEFFFMKRISLITEIYATWTKQNKQPFMIFFFVSKSAYVKKKIRFISKKDTNQFLIWEKFKSASKKDANPFILKKKSNLHLRKM